MYTVSLMAAPARADLDDDTIAALQRRWGGGSALWLDQGTAVEFAIPAWPEDFDAARDALRQHAREEAWGPAALALRRALASGAEGKGQSVTGRKSPALRPRARALSTAPFAMRGQVPHAATSRSQSPARASSCRGSRREMAP